MRIEDLKLGNDLMEQAQRDADICDVLRAAIQYLEKEEEDEFEKPIQIMKKELDKRDAWRRDALKKFEDL